MDDLRSICAIFAENRLHLGKASQTSLDDLHSICTIFESINIIGVMEEELKKKLAKDPNGLMTYEYIANNIERIDSILPELVDNIISVDRTGQFITSTARYLNAINAEKYASAIDTLIKAAISRDREHMYLADLISGIWGEDYRERADELCKSDDNFRRIYKRLYPTSII